MKNKSLVITTSLFFGLVVLLFSTNINQTYSQQEQNMTTTTTTIAEGFKDCFLDFKSKNVFGVGQDLVRLIGLACYETYKAEGKFPDQMSQIELSNITKTLNELQKASDLDKILRAFGQY